MKAQEFEALEFYQGLLLTEFKYPIQKELELVLAQMLCKKHVGFKFAKEIAQKANAIMLGFETRI
ncbi:hypothetical protein [Rickettsia oklahomensis]|uniref:Uncharacterized protein n=1 Tax=Rickettsia oklahomensis TaxID=3141789 RepID=A0AAU7BXS5_9RICK